MTEIEKLFENAGIEPQYKKRTECKDGYTVGHPCEKWIACINCNRSVFEDVMPPFTAEKQLLLIQWLAETRPIHINFLLDKWIIEGMVRYGIKYDTFEDSQFENIKEFKNYILAKCISIKTTGDKWLAKQIQQLFKEGEWTKQS